MLLTEESIVGSPVTCSYSPSLFQSVYIVTVCVVGTEFSVSMRSNASPRDTSVVVFDITMKCLLGWELHT